MAPQAHQFAVDNPKKHPWPENTSFHYVWTTVENQCLMALVEFAKDQPFRHISLHFDGAMVDAERCRMSADFGQEAARAIQSKCGFEANLAQS